MNRTEPYAVLLRRTLDDARQPRSVEQRIVQRALSRLGGPASRAPWRALIAGAAVGATAIAGILWGITAPPGDASAPAAPATHVAAGALHAVSDPATSYRIGAHQVRVGAASQLRFIDTAPDSVALQLDRGNVRCVVDPLPAGGLFTVQTPRLRVEVVGTLFEVDSDARCSRVRVTEGRVRV